MSINVGSKDSILIGGVFSLPPKKRPGEQYRRHTRTAFAALGGLGQPLAAPGQPSTPQLRVGVQVLLTTRTRGHAQKGDRRELIKISQPFFFLPLSSVETPG